MSRAPLWDNDSIATAAVLVRFARLLNARLRETPGGTGLAFAELNVLGGIDKGYDLSSALARRLLLDAPRVSRMVESLVTSRHILREPDPEDRRCHRLRLTPRGVESLHSGRAELAAAAEGLLAELNDDERAGLDKAVSGMQRLFQLDD